MRALIFSMFLLMVGSLQLTFSQPRPDCSLLKNCKLRYPSSEDTTTYIVIKNNEHIEYVQDGKYFIRSTLKWLNDCEYDLTLAEVTVPDYPFRPGDRMHVVYHRFEAQAVFYTATIKGRSFDGKFDIEE